MTTPRPLYNAPRRLAAYLGCGCGLLLAACGNASDPHPSKHDSKLVREPWSQITRANSTTLLVNTDQETADRSGRCFIQYTTRVVTQTSHRISIELLAAKLLAAKPSRFAAQPRRCADRFSWQSTSRSAIADRGSSTRSPDSSTLSPDTACKRAPLRAASQSVATAIQSIGDTRPGGASRQGRGDNGIRQRTRDGQASAPSRLAGLRLDGGRVRPEHLVPHTPGSARGSPPHAAITRSVGAPSG